MRQAARRRNNLIKIVIVTFVVFTFYWHVNVCINSAYPLQYKYTFLLRPCRASGVLRSDCLSVCPFVRLSVCEHISGTAGPIFTKFCMPIPCGHGSVLLWRRCDTSCISGFMDDVTFGRSGPYGDAWTAEPQPSTRRRSDTGAESDVNECLVWIWNVFAVRAACKFFLNACLCKVKHVSCSRHLFLKLSWLNWSYKLVKMLSLCVCVQVLSRCTQRLVILHAQTCWWTLIAY